MLEERRKYQRYDLMEFIQYTCPSEASDTALKGMIKNYSYHGICLIISQPLAVGQKIIVKTMGAPSSRIATVRWQENIRRGAYEVGLEYIS
jgi:c-di-GMP-binding flagellar brake protein YcgR